MFEYQGNTGCLTAGVEAVEGVVRQLDGGLVDSNQVWTPDQKRLHKRLEKRTLLEGPYTPNKETLEKRALGETLFNTLEWNECSQARQHQTTACEGETASRGWIHIGGYSGRA